jgi:hypothetical protein
LRSWDDLQRVLWKEKFVVRAHVQQVRPGRLAFAAEIRATELNSGSEVWGETTNLSRGGCYVRTSQAFPQDTLLSLEIRYEGMTFLSDARVAYGAAREGMGLAFLNVPASQLRILENWLSSAAAKQPSRATRGTTE